MALAFASGGLLGDAFLHLIPHSMGHSHGEEHHDGHEHHHHDHKDDGHDHHHHEEHNHHHEHDHHDHSQQTNAGLYIVLGIVLFFIIEKLIHFLKGEHGHSHSHGHKKAKVSDTEDDEQEDKDEQQQLLRPAKKHYKKKMSKKALQKNESGKYLIASFMFH